MTEGTMRAIGQFNLTITACNIARLLRLVRLVGVAANTMAVISVYQSTDLISEINRAERKWLLQSRGSASFLFRELGAQGSEVMSFHITRGPASSNPKGKALSVSQRSIQSRIHCVHGGGGRCRSLASFFFFTSLSSTNNVLRMQYQIVYIGIYKTSLLEFQLSQRWQSDGMSEMEQLLARQPVLHIAGSSVRHCLEGSL